MSAVLLVEGESDAAVVQALASRRGIRLGAPAVVLAPTGGAMAATRTLRALGERAAVVLALSDERESPYVQRALTGPCDALYVCRADLEDELIRAVGVRAALAVLARPATCAPSGPCRGRSSTATARSSGSCTASSGRARVGSNASTWPWPSRPRSAPSRRRRASCSTRSRR